MATLDSLFERVWDEMPSVTESMALRALSDSVKEFCVRTHVWRGVVDAVLTTDGFYHLVPPEGTVVTAVKSVRAGATWLCQAAPFAPTRNRFDIAPMAYTQSTPSLLELDSETGEPLLVNAALTLAQGRTDVDVPDDLADEYGEAIAAGAKMRLARMMNQDWSNPAAAPGFAAIYYTAVTAAKRRLTNSLDQAELRVELRAWV